MKWPFRLVEQYKLETTVAVGNNGCWKLRLCFQPAQPYQTIRTGLREAPEALEPRELLDGCTAEGRRPQEVLRCVHVGLLCVQEDPQLRPSMASVVVMFNSRSITLPAFAAVRVGSVHAWSPGTRGRRTP